MANGSVARSLSASPPSAYSRRRSAYGSLRPRSNHAPLDSLASGPARAGAPRDRQNRQEPAGRRRSRMSQQQPEVHEGLEGVVAFATEIAETDKEGSSLRYRGVDIEELVGRVPFEKVWGLLVDGSYEPGLPPAEPYNIAIHTCDVRADVQAS